MSNRTLTWSVYGRHLQWVATREQAQSDPYGVGVRLGEAAAEAGFDRVDLTVREGGLVEPDRVGTHLPAMLNGVRASGMQCDRITSAITPPVLRPTDAVGGGWWQDQNVEPILRTAAAHGILWCRIGTTSFEPKGFGDDFVKQLNGMRSNAAQLAQLAQAIGITLIYHTWNRPGRLDVSTAVWDIVEVFRDLGPHIGLNFDIGHVVADGPQSLWRINMRRAMPWIRALSLTDVKWERNATGQWKVSYPPAGEDGMVPWSEFFALAHEGGFAGQASLQLEFTTTGALGQPLDLNAAFWADHPQFLSGNATRTHVLACFSQQLRYFKTQAAASGWQATTPP